VSNDLNILSPESAEIDKVNGIHMSGKSNESEIYFHSENKIIKHFPRGLEKFFKNLIGIAIWHSQLQEIHQEDLKHYTKLKYLNLFTNNIKIIEDGLFYYQADIEVIVFERCKIFHIITTVLDYLFKLSTLLLNENQCTNKFAINNQTGVREVIRSIKSTCISSNYTKLDEKLKNIERKSKNLNNVNILSFSNDFQNFSDDLQNSKFSGYHFFEKRITAVSSLVFLWNKIESVTKSQNDKISNIERILSSRTLNPWAIIATGIIGFTQIIFLAVIYKQFLA
jgi:hypothetical protein